MLGISRPQNGGIIFANGINRVFSITLINMTLSGIECLKNGGVIYMLSSVNKAGFTCEYSNCLLDSSSEKQFGTSSISDSNFSNILAQNGGIVCENTPIDTLKFSFHSNTLRNIVAHTRGGAFYLIKPLVSIHTSIFNNLSAERPGLIVYSVSNQINLTNFKKSNMITPPLMSIASYAPTNLLVSFTSIYDNSTIIMEYENTPPYNPIVPNLTSYSLSEYQIRLYLVSNNSQGSHLFTMSLLILLLL